MVREEQGWVYGWLIVFCCVVFWTSASRWSDSVPNTGFPLPHMLLSSNCECKHTRVASNKSDTRTRSSNQYCSSCSICEFGVCAQVSGHAYTHSVRVEWWWFLSCAWTAPAKVCHCARTKTILPRTCGFALLWLRYDEHNSGDAQKTKNRTPASIARVCTPVCNTIHIIKYITGGAKRIKTT